MPDLAILKKREGRGLAKKGFMDFKRKEGGTQGHEDVATGSAKM